MRGNIYGYAFGSPWYRGSTYPEGVLNGEEAEKLGLHLWVV